MLKRIFLSVACALVIASCQDKNLLIPKAETDQNKLEESTHSIPIEKALSALDEYLEQSGDIGTKSGAKRTVRATIPVRIKEALTRSEVPDTVDCENLVYVANFESNEGYAILAADDRIRESVIAVIDNGYLDEETIGRAMSRVISNNKPETQRLTIDGYPLTGPGSFASTLCLDYAFEEVFGNGDEGSGDNGGSGPDNWERPELDRPDKDNQKI